MCPRGLAAGAAGYTRCTPGALRRYGEGARVESTVDPHSSGSLSSTHHFGSSKAQTSSEYRHFPHSPFRLRSPRSVSRCVALQLHPTLGLPHSFTLLSASPTATRHTAPQSAPGGAPRPTPVTSAAPWLAPGPLLRARALHTEHRPQRLSLGGGLNRGALRGVHGRGGCGRAAAARESLM